MGFKLEQRHRDSFGGDYLENTFAPFARSGGFDAEVDIVNVETRELRRYRLQAEQCEVSISTERPSIAEVILAEEIALAHERAERRTKEALRR